MMFKVISMLVILSLSICMTKVEGRSLFQRTNIRVNLCDPCGGSHTNVYSEAELMRDVRRRFFQITIETAVETCRFHNDIFNRDSSPIDSMSYYDIHTPTQDSTNDASSLVEAYNILTNISLFRKLGQLDYSFDEGLNAEFSMHNTRHLLCSIKQIAALNNIAVPHSTCSKQMVLSNSNFSRSMFGNWMYFILRQNKYQLCEVKNLLSSSISGLRRSSCTHSSIPEHNC